MMKKKKTLSKKNPLFVKDGKYERLQELKIMFPYQFLLLCKLVQVPPKTMLHHFMHDLGRESWQRHQDEGIRTSTADYFLLRGYGQDYYTPEDLRKMLHELDCIGSLWPENGSMKLIDKHARWRDHYYKYWFNKWFYKVRRKKENGTPGG